MRKNSVLYRRLWYAKRRNAGRINVILRLAAVIMILALLVSYANSRLLPTLLFLSESKARMMVTLAVNDAVHRTFAERLKYEEIVYVHRDENGSITSIETDMIKLGELSSELSADIKSRLFFRGEDGYSLPLGTLMGPVLTGYGPQVNVRVYPYGNIQAAFRSEFKREGVNRTRHRIYLNVDVGVGIAAPLVDKKTAISASIPIAETVIVGKVPKVYTDGG